MKRNTIAKRRLVILISIIICVVAAIFVFLVKNNGDEKQKAQETFPPVETGTVTPTQQPAQTDAPTQAPEQPDNTSEPSETPGINEQPEDKELIIRTDYEAFKPNEVGEIPIVMFHNFIEAFEPNTEKEFTTTFEEFENLLYTLYDEGYRLISMREFIDCNISVPAGTKPMVFTFDDGSSGQFNLIEKDGKLEVNPNSAVGVMLRFNEKYPDFGLKGIFYVNMNIGDNTFKGEGSLKERFEILESLGFELGNHTWGHVKYNEVKSIAEIEESLGKNQKKADEILPGLRFYSLALPHGSRPENKSWRTALVKGTYEGMHYYNETIMAVGANPSKPSISKDYNSQYVSRIRAQGREMVECDLTWWLPKMTNNRMFVSDGDPKTIVVPEEKSSQVDIEKLKDKTLVTY
ncbi:MAG: polysaccharide deacetylase [Clostridiaceae bacterium]|nr:polysaccharide deacetylase [Clostridiaceae bacterium]